MSRTPPQSSTEQQATALAGKLFNAGTKSYAIALRLLLGEPISKIVQEIGVKRKSVYNIRSLLRKLVMEEKLREIVSEETPRHRGKDIPRDIPQGTSPPARVICHRLTQSHLVRRDPWTPIDS